MIERLAFIAIAPVAMVGDMINLSGTARDAPLSFGVASVGEGGTITLVRAADGLFHVPVRMNGQTVMMVVDTGANRSVFPRSQFGGLPVRADGGWVETLDGKIRYQNATVDRIGVGEVLLSDVEVVVADVAFPAPLMGQDILARLGPMTIDGDRLHLSAKRRDVR